MYMNDKELSALRELLIYSYEEYKHWNKSGFPKDHIYPIGVEPLEKYYNKVVARKNKNERTILDFV